MRFITWLNVVYPASYLLLLNLGAILVLFTIVCSLLIRKNNVMANVLLAVIVLYVPLSISLNVLFIIFHQHRLLFLAPLNIGINLTFGPVLLCYIALIQGKSIKSIVRRVWHFVPSTIVVLSATYYLLIPENEQLLLLNHLLAGTENYINALNLFLLVHVGVYLYAAWKQVSYYKHTATDLGVYETEITIKWQEAFLWCIIIINVLLLLAYALPILVKGEADVYSDLIVVPVVAICMYAFIIYKGLSYHVIFNKSAYQSYTDSVAPLNHFIEEVEQLEKPQKYPQYDEEFNHTLHQLFSSQKIHTKPSLKLHDVALMLKMSPAVLSAVINANLKMTFFEMVNTYRVEEAKQMLIKPENHSYKIEYIGELSGFNSRASFFAVFKKHTGKTPLAYRDEYVLAERQQA